MAFFSEKKEVKGSKKDVVKKEDDKALLPVSSKNALFADVLLRPMVTEKAHAISAQGQYAFFTDVRTSKAHIKNAVEQLYSVHVRAVSTSRVKPKKRIRGKEVGYTRRMKKVIVSLRKGETIALFEGV